MRRILERGIASAGLLALLAGCYQYVPVATSANPPVGDTYSFGINDAGRVELTSRMGSGVSRIEGRLVGTEGNDYLIDVFRVENISGDRSQWSGETVRLNRDIVDQIRERELSKRRTWTAVGISAATVAALILTRGIFGLFTDEIGPPDNTDPPDKLILAPITGPLKQNIKGSAP